MKKWREIKNLRAIIAGVMLLLTVILYSMGAAVQENMRNLYGDFYQIRMRDKPLSVSQAKSLMQTKQLTEEGAEVSYTLWTQIGNIPAKNVELGNEMSIDVLYYYGEKNKQFDLNLENGCVLSKKAAFHFWGTDEILGETLEIDGEKYIVERVSEDLRVGAVAKVDKEEDRSFDVFDVTVWQNGAAFSMEELLAENPIESTLLLNYNELLSLLETLSALPLWLIAVTAAILLLRKAYESRKKWERAVALGGSALLPLMLCYTTLGVPMVVWERFIPVKWSDFSFWQEAFSGALEEFQTVSSMEQYAFDTEFWNLFYGVVIMSTIAAALFAGGVLLLVQSAGKERIKNGFYCMQKRFEEIRRNKGGNRFLSRNKG